MTIKNNELPPLEDMLAEFESGSIPRSETWQALITGLYLNVEQVAEIEKWYEDINTIYGQIIEIEKEMQESYGQIQLWYGQVDVWQQQVAVDKVAAASSAVNAASSAGAALASENKAYKWAEEKEDVEVEPGEYSSHHWANKAKQHSGSITNGMFFAGRWDMKDGLPPEPDENLVPWYRIVAAEEPANRKEADPVWLALVDDAKPGDQLCWDPIAKEYFIVDCTDKVWSVNGMEGDVVIATPAPPGRLNFLINGDFQIWQREVSFDTYKTFTADRWYIEGQDSNKVQVSKNGDALNVINTAGSRGERTVLWQRIEMSPNRYAKAPFNLSFIVGWNVKPTSYSVVIYWINDSYEATGDVLQFPEMPENGRQSQLFNAPEAPADAVYLHVEFLFTGAFNVDIRDVLMSLGPNLYPFPYTPKTEELSLCQRYYEKSYDMDELPGTNVGVDTGVYGSMLHVNCGVYNSTGVSVSTAFKVTKFKRPEITTFSSSGLSGQVSTNLGAKLSSVSLGQNAFHVGISDVQYFGCHWTAEAEIK